MFDTGSSSTQIGLPLVLVVVGEPSLTMQVVEFIAEFSVIILEFFEILAGREFYGTISSIVIVIIRLGSDRYFTGMFRGIFAIFLCYDVFVEWYDRILLEDLVQPKCAVDEGL